MDGAPADMREIIHPHWATFPPQNQMINGLLAFLYFVFWIVNGFGNTAVISVFFKYTNTMMTSAITGLDTLSPHIYLRKFRFFS